MIVSDFSDLEPVLRWQRRFAWLLLVLAAVGLAALVWRVWA